MHLTAEYGDRCGGAAFVRHVREFHPRHRLEKLTHEVRPRTRAGRGHTVADVMVILGSIDIVMGEVDR